MKKILFTIALLTILTAGCSKKENSSKNGNALKQFDTDEAFGNRKSYNLIKSVIDNSIPYAQMLCINPHMDLNITDINAVKSKIVKITEVNYSIENNSNEMSPIVYTTSYFKFNETGFIEKTNEYNWAKKLDKILPLAYSSLECKLTNFGIDVVSRRNGELYDKFTITFENENSGVNMKEHNQLTGRFTSNIYENANYKTTYEPGAENYRVDDYNTPGNYSIYENGIMTKTQEGKYLYYIDENITTKVNLETGKKETNSELITTRKTPIGIPIYKKVVKRNDDTIYIEKIVEVLESYDKDFLILNTIMAEDKVAYQKKLEENQNKSSE